jgi:hypothetical protein
MWAQRIEVQRGKRVATVALARRLAGILFAMWRDRTSFEPRRIRTVEPGKLPTVAGCDERGLIERGPALGELSGIIRSGAPSEKRTVTGTWGIGGRRRPNGSEPHVRSATQRLFSSTSTARYSSPLLCAVST